MANSNTEHSKKLRRDTANKFYREKIQSGEYSQMLVKGKAEDMAVIQAAIDKAGGSRVQALKAICQAYLNSETA